MIIHAYINKFSKKTKMTKAQKASLKEYNEWRTSNKMSKVETLKAKLYTRSFLEYKPKNINYKTTEHIKSLETDTKIEGNRTSIMDPINLNRESKEIQEAILAKSKRIAQMYNKGGYQYITDDIDIKTIGTRNRRM